MCAIKMHWRGLRPRSRASPMGHGRQRGSILKASISAAAIEPPASRFPGWFVPYKISGRNCLNSSRPCGEPRAAGDRMLDGAAPAGRLGSYFNHRGENRRCCGSSTTTKKSLMAKSRLLPIAGPVSLSQGARRRCRPNRRAWCRRRDEEVRTPVALRLRRLPRTVGAGLRGRVRRQLPQHSRSDGT
jgi:hypothetical protein